MSSEISAYSPWRFKLREHNPPEQPPTEGDTPTQVTNADHTETNITKENTETPITKNKKYWKDKLRHIVHNTQFCGICLCGDELENCVSDHIEVFVGDKFHETTLHHILRTVFHETEDLLSNSLICNSCTKKLIQSYIFIQQTRETSRLMKHHLSDLYNKTCYIRNNILKDSYLEDAKVFNVVIDLDTIHMPYIFDNVIVDNSDISENNDNITNNDNNVSNDSVNNNGDGVNGDKDKAENNGQINNENNISIFNDVYENVSQNHEENYEANDGNHNNNVKIKTNTRRKRIVQKQLQCKKCKCSFKTKLHLDFHIKHQCEFRCKICNEIVPNGELLVHLQKNHVNSSRLCSICYIGFHSDEDLEIHKEEWHSIEESKCAICLKKLEEPENHECKMWCDSCATENCVHNKYLMCHTRQVLNGAVTTQCLDCKHMCKTKENLLAHVNIIHLKHKPYACEICGTKFYAKQSLTAHTYRYHNSSFFCCTCRIIFHQWDVFQDHLKTKHKKRKFPCNQCKSRFFSAEACEKHKKEKHNKVIACEICKKVFTKNYNKKLHMLYSHNGSNKLKECDICKKKFVYKHDLVKHIMLHNSDEKYICKVCNTKFVNLKAYQKHSLTHSVICEICGENVAPSLLKRHLNTHKKWKCVVKS